MTVSFQAGFISTKHTVCVQLSRVLPRRGEMLYIYNMRFKDILSFSLKDKRPSQGNVEGKDGSEKVVSSQDQGETRIKETLPMAENWPWDMSGCPMLCCMCLYIHECIDIIRICTWHVKAEDKLKLSSLS